MRHRPAAAIAIVLVLAAGAVSRGPPDSGRRGTPKPSQHGEVSQRIAATTITLVYNRPVARGRELFGSLVPYEPRLVPVRRRCDDHRADDGRENQRPDAGGGDVLGVDASRGRRRGPSSSTARAQAWHTRYPAGQDALRVKVTPRTGSHMETLAFYFPVVDGRKAELVLHWGTVVVPLAIEVPVSFRLPACQLR